MMLVSLLLYLIDFGCVGLQKQSRVVPFSSNVNSLRVASPARFGISFQKKTGKIYFHIDVLIFCV